MTKRPEKFHGRVEGAGQRCAVPGCGDAGEFRAPLTPGDFDGPGEVRWLCLDHVRQHNSAYNYFAGMSAEEIEAAQSPIPRRAGEGGRRFAYAPGADPGPRWADFDDPLDAIAARFRDAATMREERRRSRFSAEERGALRVLGLGPEADLHAVRKAYAGLVRRYHPDRNGGDRRHEARLRAVIDAFQRLRKSTAFG
ncbi:J domain-containing protein [Sphingomicrobium astaxanthinifaciens]|uniref:J domain-containing protein n=1 Tax=Sphingomicrobium astaxanthinifaciens TaxID=1227949 RepID=UPI001FCB8B5C|nr:J domain-containing protein [Sphingomicrobium astaxanthinifaciens]MCJ7421384.1 J domain-containing protein [Sphingomicrobium astaxanthinifaciens]